LDETKDSFQILAASVLPQFPSASIGGEPEMELIRQIIQTGRNRAPG
jgi:hypothetical protein